MVFDERINRTLLVLGPPHSGKSVFSYLLFKFLREQGNDAALLDCDIFSPTFRPYNMTSVEEDKHVYVPANSDKMPEDIEQDLYRNLINYFLIAVRERGIIIMDGMGKYTDKTEVLLEKARYLAIVCRDKLSVDDMSSSNYIIEDKPTHPFEFYSKTVDNCLKLTTYEEAGNAAFNTESLEGELSGLSRSAIKEGNIVAIPADTCTQISSIVQFLTSNWFR